MKKVLHILLGIFIPLVAFGMGFSLLPKASVTVHVVDEAGVPLQGATVGVGFIIPREGGIGASEDSKKGLSDHDGLYSATARTVGRVGIKVEMEGYYKTTDVLEFRTSSNGKWQPWNLTSKIILKKVVNPVPMYARQVQAEIPGADAEFGYDLIEADWVAPHGKGKIGDFKFMVERRFETYSDYDATLRISFSNLGDGIFTTTAERKHGSQLRLPRHAPADGYQPHLVSKFSRKGPDISGESHDSNTAYFFRVRTVLDDQGNVLSAMYGKIHGPILLGVISSKTGNILFMYHLNPDGTTNMEFDPKKNLFKELNRRRLGPHQP
jgi:hypothetical protein